MSQIDPRPTRTAEPVVLSATADAADAGGVRGNWAEQTQRLLVEPMGPIDSTAVNFAHARERALGRLDHSAAVRRLRRSLSIGIFIWFSTVLMDLFVTQVLGQGSLPVFLWARAVGTLSILVTLWRLGREPEPSVPVLWFCDMFVFTMAASCVTVTALAHGGLDSPYASGVVVILLARGATTLAPWQHGAWLFAVPALAYPTIMLVVSRFDPSIAEQLGRPHTLGAFLCEVFMLVVSWVLLVLGGHFAWRLRREAVETRNIGRYKLTGHLGTGGMGDVWAAFDLGSRQRVALKTVYGHHPGSPVLARLEREVRALAELTHPNIVRVFDYGVTDDGLWYYAMELLHGETLRELVARDGALPVERLLPIARQVLQALGEAHGKGIIHRDIKPENVFVAELGGELDVVKLLDFGIATTNGDPKLTSTGHVAGTPAYMAPETILGRPADIRSDIYSFGATLYYALTARLPFQDQDPQALFAAHVSRPIGALSAVTNQPIPRAIERVVHTCMAKEPAERYPSTHALLSELVRVGEVGEVAELGQVGAERRVTPVGAGDRSPSPRR